MLENCSNERGVLRKECRLQGKRTRKDNKDNNSGGYVKPNVSFYKHLLNKPAVLFQRMAARLSWSVCWNALMYVRLFKFCSSSGY